MKKTLVVFLLSLWHELLAEEYSIQRRLSRNYNTKQDRFIFPISKCSGDVSAKCTAKGGTLVGRNNKCTCQCNRDKSTFGFYNSWKCIENAQVHALSGCLLRLNDRRTSIPIITITKDLTDRLPTLTPAPLNCNITNKGSNLTCNGTWEQLDSTLVKARFGIEQDIQNNWKLFTKSIDDIEGQVIRINIECQSHQYCVILKVEGTLQCPLPPSPSQSTTTVSGMSSTPQIRPRPPPFSTITTATITSTKSATTHKRTSQEPVQTVTNPTTNPKTLASTITTTKPTTTTTKRTSQEPVQTVTNPTSWTSILTELVSSTPYTAGHESTTRTKDSTPFTKTTYFSEKNRKKSASKERDKSGLIAGAIAGIIGLAIIAMAIMVMIRRRKKRESDEQRTDTFDNAGYGRGNDNSLRFNGQQPPDEDEYSYAYNNAAPFVKTNKQVLENYTNNDHEHGSSVANRTYGQTGELKPKASAPYNEAPAYDTLEEAVYAKVDKSRKKYPSDSDAPIYNTLEEPDYAKVDKSQKTRLSENHNEPLYNVLEGPETGEGLSEEPPCYQVLEGPFSEGAPVYDVLEGPESDEAPVYSALEGQDPRVYGALDMPDIQGSPEENRGYDDMVYDSVGEVINDQGDIYQELNQSGQRNQDVYQALNNPGKTMYLNELNQTHSSA